MGSIIDNQNRLKLALCPCTTSQKTDVDSLRAEIADLIVPWLANSTTASLPRCIVLYGGRSSGKSTFVKALMDFYVCQNETVTPYSNYQDQSIITIGSSQNTSIAAGNNLYKANAVNTVFIDCRTAFTSKLVMNHILSRIHQNCSVRVDNTVQFVRALTALWSSEDDDSLNNALFVRIFTHDLAVPEPLTFGDIVDFRTLTCCILDSPISYELFTVFRFLTDFQVIDHIESLKEANYGFIGVLADLPFIVSCFLVFL